MSKINQIVLFMVFMLVLTPFAFADELSLKKVSDLKPGDVIVDKDGNQISVSTVEPTDYKLSTNLIQIITGKLAQASMTGNVVAPITGYVNAIPAGPKPAPTPATTGASTASKGYTAYMPSNWALSEGQVGSTGYYSGKSLTTYNTAFQKSLTDAGVTQTTATPAQITAAENAGTAAAGAPTSGGSAFFGAGGADMLFTGLQWAAIAYMAVQMLGPMLGLDEKQTQSVSLALATGAGLYGALSSEGSAAVFGQSWASSGLGSLNGFASIGPAGWAIIAAAAVLLLTYKSTKTETITFSCEPWQAPNGGNKCEVCNDDTLPCSEYRCKSLGQACELVNAGTGKEKCVYVNPKDVTAPVITPNEDDLAKGYKYTNVKLSPPGPGFTIQYTNKSDGCVPAFTPLKFGITTDEPSQCKIDFNHTTDISQMAYYFGGSNLYLYNHSEQFSLPGPANLKKENLTIDNGGKWTFFIRCQDKNGNQNEAEYALRFCVDPTPDTTAPVVKATSLQEGGCIASNQTSAKIDFYMNEPSTCRWSRLDQSYDNMQGNMTCSNRLEQMNAQQLYTCTAPLDGVSRDGTDYYIRCKDNSDNKMAQSYKYSLRGSTQLLIKNVQPNETVFGGVSPAPVELFVQTNYGCDSSKSVCFYSDTGNLGDFTMFYDTNKDDGISTQKLFLPAGDKKMYIRCVDSGGNLAETTLNFSVSIDVGSPIVARVYEEDSQLKIVTVRSSECSYTNDDCSFLFEEGTEMPTANSSVHITPWMKDKIYYIKCRDEYRNSDDASCSVVVKPTETFF